MFWVRVMPIGYQLGVDGEIEWVCLLRRFARDSIAVLSFMRRTLRLDAHELERE
jgi:hypothetical protein